MIEQMKTRVTAEEFFEIAESNQPTELLEGELIVSPAAVPEHQRLNGKFYVLLLKLIPNGEVFYAPIDVYFDDENTPQPDLVWVAENSRCVIGEKYLEGPPDLIVEIISPSTADNDRKKKFQLFQRYAVSEYWIADPYYKQVEVWQWVEGKFVRLGVYGAGDTFISPVLGNKKVELSQVFN